MILYLLFLFFFKQKTAYEMRISDWSSDVCSSDLRDEKITREIWTRDEAVRYFTEHGEAFKAEHVANIPADEPLSIYRQGDWLDMCFGPHLPSTGKLGKAFKMTKLSGAYLRGDANNTQLQRIYGTSWANEKQLK